MHNNCKLFFLKHKDKFVGKNTIDVGSLNVNGAIADVVPITVGVDMREGPGVDKVLKGEDLVKEFGAEYFDVVATAETLEHVRDWREFLHGCWDSLKVGGWFIGTIAAIEKGRHAYPDDYWRLTMPLLAKMFPTALELVSIPRGEHGSQPLSMGWVVQKTEQNKSLKSIHDLHLIPVDNQVPIELLKDNPFVAIKKKEKKEA